MLPLFLSLGDEVERRWSKAAYSDESFAEIAASALEQSQVLTKVEPAEIITWLMRSSGIPEQRRDEFGQPPINVYVSDKFFIQAIFWVDGTTAVHEHAFVGAFGVLHGSSVQSTYSFSTEKVASDRLTIGRTNFLNSELLRRGDVRAIHSRDRLIHALFHLDRPSVSVVVRTPYLKQGRPQYYYFKPYLALQDDDLPSTIPIQIKMLKALLMIDRAAFWKAAAEIVAVCDPFTLHGVLQVAFNAPDAAQNWSALVNAVQELNQWLVSYIVPCLEEDQRSNKLIGLRSSTHNPDHRFFLAMLLNVPNREEVYRLMAERFPNERPQTLAVKWLGEIFKDKQAGLKLTPSSLCILQRILEGEDFERARPVLGNLFHCASETDEEKIRKAWTKLQSVDIFQPLVGKWPKQADIDIAALMRR
jgi:hypothetical protein